MLGDHCKLINCSKKPSAQGGLAWPSGGMRIASDHWMGDGMRRAFRCRRRARIKGRPFSRFEYTPYQMPRWSEDSQKGRGGIFQPPPALDDKTGAHQDLWGRASSPAHFHLSQVSYLNKSISCLYCVSR